MSKGPENLWKILFSHDSKQLISIHYDCNVAYLWEVATGIMISKFEGHTMMILDMSILLRYLIKYVIDGIICIA